MRHVYGAIETSLAKLPQKNHFVQVLETELAYVMEILVEEWSLNKQTSGTFEVLCLYQ